MSTQTKASADALMKDKYVGKRKKVPSPTDRVPVPKTMRKRNSFQGYRP